MKVIKKVFISSICAIIMMPTHLQAFVKEDASETTPSAFGETTVVSNSNTDNIVTKENFPDENFRKALLGNKERLTKQELENITTLDLSMKNIKNLEGISYLTNLTSLNISLNALTSLDLSNNTKLTWLDASNNALVTVDKLPSSLKYLNLFGNYTIGNVDVKNLCELWYLNVAVNALTSIDLSGNPKLTHLFLEENQLTSLDLSHQMELNEKFFRVYDNLLTKIITPKLARSIPVSLFYVQGNNDDPWTLNGEEINKESMVLFDGGTLRKGIYETDDITEERFPDANFRKALIQAGITDNASIAATTDLDLSMKNISNITGIESFSNLKTLNISVNKIESIDCLKSLSNLTWLDASNNILTEVKTLPVSLKYLNVFGNYKITSVDVSSLTQLWYLNVAVNSLEQLDVTNNKELTQLYVEENKLKTLDLSNQTKLDENYLKLYRNQLEKLITPNLERAVPVSLFFLQDESDEAWMVKGKSLKESDSVVFDGSILTRGASELDYITSSNFPDENFRKALIRQGITSQQDVQNTKKLDVSMQNITDIKGIELFTNLETLNVSVNKITSLDCLQSLSTLTWLDASNNNIKLMKQLPGSLKYLDASSNYEISDVDISNLKNLWYLNLAVNSLQSIDLSSNLELTHLFLQENKLTKLDLSNQTKLDTTFFALYKNELKEVITPKLTKTVASSTFYQQNVNSGYETVWKMNDKMLSSFEDIVFDGSTLVSETKGKAYKYVFHANDKSSTSKEIDAIFGEEQDLDENFFTREGYSFVGWAYKANASNTDVINQAKLKIDQYPSNGRIDLYAVWKANEYIVKFHSDNETDSVIEQKFTYDVQNSLKLNSFTKEGKKFIGWSTTKNGKKNYFNGEYVKNLTSTNNGIVDLYALWDDITYTASFNVNGGNEYIPSQIVSYKEKVNEPANPTRKGYTFMGWMDENLKNIYDFNQVLTSNISLKAIWKANSYTVSYHANGAAGSMENQEFVYDKDNLLKTNLFKKEGYQFIGWSVTPNGNVVYKDQQSVKNITAENEKNITLYAQWQKDVKTVVLNNNGLSETKKIEYNDEMVLPTLTKKGYRFLGWSLNGKSLVSSKSIVITDNVCLYAKWTPVTYKINYQVNGGRVSGNPTVYNITSKTIYLKNPTRVGYVFGGWYSDAKYRTRVTQIKAGSVGNRTLYAKWIKVVKPGSVRLKSVKNNAKSKIYISYQGIKGVSGYEIVYSTNNRFTKSSTKYTSSTTISGLKKGKIYYIKVRAFKKDSAGKKIYGNYGNVMKIKITK